jgi:tRNA pseudouridine38-40 synthase
MESMRQSSLVLNGIHRFGAFCKQDPVPDDLHCTIYAAEWRREGRELIFEIEGNRFLRHMVRILVGTMFEIGLGKRPPNNLATLLQSGRRTEAGRTAPSRGLHLLWVRYES